jgi:hypothetical protein
MLTLKSQTKELCPNYAMTLCGSMFSKHNQYIPTSKNNMIDGPHLETYTLSNTSIYDDHVYAPKTRDRRDATRHRPLRPTYSVIHAPFG